MANIWSPTVELSTQLFNTVQNYSVLQSLSILNATIFNSASGLVNVIERAAGLEYSGGKFLWVSGNQSANVTADTTKTIWVPLSVNPSGSLGAFKRLQDGYVTPQMMGIFPLTASGTGVGTVFAAATKYLATQNIPVALGLSEFYADLPIPMWENLRIDFFGAKPWRNVRDSTGDTRCAGINPGNWHANYFDSTDYPAVVWDAANNVVATDVRIAPTDPLDLANFAVGAPIWIRSTAKYNDVPTGGDTDRYIYVRLFQVIAKDATYLYLDRGIGEAVTAPFITNANNAAVLDAQTGFPLFASVNASITNGHVISDFGAVMQRGASLRFNAHFRRAEGEQGFFGNAFHGAKVTIDSLLSTTKLMDVALNSSGSEFIIGSATFRKDLFNQRAMFAFNEGTSGCYVRVESLNGGDYSLTNTLFNFNNCNANTFEIFSPSVPGSAGTIVAFVCPNRNKIFTGTASFSGTVMTVVTVTSGNLAVGDQIYGVEGLVEGYIIASLGTGTGGAGTYNLNLAAPTLTTRTTSAARPSLGNAQDSCNNNTFIMRGKGVFGSTGRAIRMNDDGGKANLAGNKVIGGEFNGTFTVAAIEVAGLNTYVDMATKFSSGGIEWIANATSCTIFGGYAAGPINARPPGNMQQIYTPAMIAKGGYKYLQNGNRSFSGILAGQQLLSTTAAGITILPGALKTGDAVIVEVYGRKVGTSGSTLYRITDTGGANQAQVTNVAASTGAFAIKARLAVESNTAYVLSIDDAINAVANAEATTRVPAVDLDATGVIINFTFDINNALDSVDIREVRFYLIDAIGGEIK